MRRQFTTDDWRAAYRQWVFAQQLLSAVQHKVLAARREKRRDEQVQRDASAIGHLEEQVQLKREAMDRCLLDIVARRTPRMPSAAPAQEATEHELVRMSIAVAELGPALCRWELLALFADGSVVTLDQSTDTFTTREAAREAGRAAVPPLPTGRF